MFVVEIGFFITLLLTFVPTLFGGTDTSLRTYNLIVSIILLVTVPFANFAESVAEDRGKAQAASLKKISNEITLNTLLVSLTIIFLIVIETLYPIGIYSGVQRLFPR